MDHEEPQGVKENDRPSVVEVSVAEYVRVVYQVLQPSASWVTSLILFSFGPFHVSVKFNQRHVRGSEDPQLTLTQWIKARTSSRIWTYHSPFHPHSLEQAFFLTPAAEKTKTQGQNSSKKLNLWEDVPSHMQNSRKKLNFMKLSHQNSKFSKGWRFLHHFY